MYKKGNAYRQDVMGVYMYKVLEADVTDMRKGRTLYIFVLRIYICNVYMPLGFRIFFGGGIYAYGTDSTVGAEGVVSE